MRFKKGSFTLIILAILMIAAFQNCGEFNSATTDKPEPPIEKTSIETETAIHLVLDE